MMVCAIIYTHNSAEHIESLVLRTRSVLEPDVFILDNQSTDDTVAIAQRAGAKRLEGNTPENGLVVHALRKVQALKFTHAVFLNANNPTHVPEQIPLFVSAIWDSPHSIFVAQSKPTRRISVSNALLAASAMCSIKDAWNSFRIYPIDDILKLNCKEEGDNFAPEALVRASWAGIHTEHLELNASCPTEDEIGNSPKAILFSVKLFGGMLVRFPLLLRKRLTLQTSKIR